MHLIGVMFRLFKHSTLHSHIREYPFSLFACFLSAWVFQDATTKTPYLYFVPYKVIPTTPEHPTIGSNGRTGLFRFSIVEATHHEHFVGVSDAILPLPGTLDQPLKAIHWTLAHLDRWEVLVGNTSTTTFTQNAETLQKYLVHILNHPQVVKYRHLRIASHRFGPLWNSPIRGLLLAVGFVEDKGYARLGTGEEDISLPSHKIQDVALLSYLVSRHEQNRNNRNPNNLSNAQQPAGAMNGFGRAGFGRAGAME